MKIRVHTDTTTIESQEFDDAVDAQVRAERIVKDGAWDGNKLYPPHRIVMVELIPS